MSKDFKFDSCRAFEGALFTTGSAENSNRNVLRNPTPVFPSIKAGKTVGAHQPHKRDVRIEKLQALNRIYSVLKILASFEIGNDNMRMIRNLLRFSHACFERRVVVRVL